MFSMESEVKLSRGPLKSRVWSLDPTEGDLTGPDCIDKLLLQLIDSVFALINLHALTYNVVHLYLF